MAYPLLFDQFDDRLDIPPVENVVLVPQHMQRAFPVGMDVLRVAEEFARVAVQNDYQDRRDFVYGEARSNRQFMSDVLLGKVGEFAFQRFAAQFGVGTEVSLMHMRDIHVTDGGDDLGRVTLNGVPVVGRTAKVDVKQTKMRSAWLLVEHHKFKRKSIYVWTRTDVGLGFYQDPTDWVRRADRDTNIFTEVVGFCFGREFFDPDDGQRPLFNLLRGQNAYTLGQVALVKERTHKGVESALSGQPRNLKFREGGLKVDNYGMPMSWLRSDEGDWVKFFQWITRTFVR